MESTFATDDSATVMSTLPAMSSFILAAESMPEGGWPGDDLTVVAWSLVVIVLLVAAVATAINSPSANDLDDHH